MIAWIRCALYLAPAACALVLCGPQAGGTCLAASDVSIVRPPGEAAKQGGGAGPASRQKAGSYTRQITRRGKTVVISRRLADEVKKDNQIVLSGVAIKTSVDKDGDLAGYELVQIDNGSIAEKIGFRPRDRIIAVNGIPVRRLEPNQASLQSAGRLEVTILRKGRTRKIVVEIGGTGR